MSFEKRLPDMFAARENKDNERIEDEPLYARGLNTYGKVVRYSSKPENKLYADGYEVGENGYIAIKDEEGVKIYPRNYDDGEPISEDDEDYEKIMNMVSEDETIRKARTEYATELANGDEKLRYVLLKHLEKNDGCMSDPWEYDGIEFYNVDELRHYDIFLGVKDGKIYRMYVETIIGSVCRVEEVSDVEQNVTL